MKTLDLPGAGSQPPASHAAIWFRLFCLVVSMSTGIPGVCASDTGAVPPSSPYFRILCINELQSENRFTLFDNRREADPWIELYNPGPKPLSLEEFSLSDNYFQFQRWRFPKGAVINPGQYLIVWLDGEAEQSNSDQFHCSLRLNPKGGSLALSMLIQGKPMVVDYLDYPALDTDLSYGLDQRPQLGGRYRIFAQPTPGGVNAMTPSLVINEWLVSPPRPQASWFELYNPGRETVDLTGLSLFLFGPTTQSPMFPIPKGRKIAGGGFFRVWADGNPDLNATDPSGLHVPFRLPSDTFTLQLFDQAGSLIHQVVTKVPDAKRAEARYPDGARFVGLVDLPTPGAPNVGVPRFTQVPQDHQGRASESWSWSAAAVGTLPIRFQWYFNQAPIAGATSSTLDFKSLRSSDAGFYRLEAFNVAGSAFLDLQLQVAELPRITVDAPLELPVSVGKVLRLPAGALGTGPLEFQWKRNGVNIPNANQQSYTKDIIDLDDGGSYTAVVANGAGVVLSAPVRVLIDLPVVKAADDFRDAFDLKEDPSGSLRSSNRGASQEKGEPLHDGNSGGRSVWFRWRATKDGIAAFNTRGSTFDTLLAVYTGESVNTLKKVESDDDGGAYYTSSLRFNASSRLQYYIAVDGYGGDTNDFLLHWNLNSTSLKIPEILRHPDSQTGVPGTRVQFRVVANNASTFQWLFNGNRLIGQTDDVLTLEKVDVKSIGLYSVLVTSPERQVVQSRHARLQLGDLPREVWEDKYDPPSLPFSVPSLTGEDQAGLAEVATVSVTAGTIGSQFLNLKGAAGQPSEPPPCGVVGGYSLIQKFRLTTNATLIVDTFGSTIDTVLSIYSIGAAPPLKYVTCNRNGASSLVQFAGKSSTTYYAFIDAVKGDTNDLVQINWRCGELPQLQSVPFTNTVNSGDSFQLTTRHVAVPLVTSVQWLLDGVVIPGQNSTNLTISPAAPEHAGNYSIVLSNAMGSVTGLVANIFVSVPFQLSASPLEGQKGTDVILHGLAEQGFMVEASLDMQNWCYFYLNSIPLDPFEYVLANPEGYSKLFFRCQPWPATPPYSPTPCPLNFP
jgi:hypothetical protein